MFSAELVDEAQRLLSELRTRQMMLATAESCTGGLLTGLLTEVPGASDVVERGFVTYSNKAKISCLGVPSQLLAKHGAVSAEVALAMAEGALVNSEADLAIAVTGVAGPGGGSAKKPVGLVWLAIARAGGTPLRTEWRFGDLGRSRIRLEALRAALAFVRQALDTPANGHPE
jgi:nicotinamide-nucleotide amidase